MRGLARQKDARFFKSNAQLSPHPSQGVEPSCLERTSRWAMNSSFRTLVFTSTSTSSIAIVGTHDIITRLRVFAKLASASSRRNSQ